MSGHERIICFKHCDGHVVFCRSVPEACPYCNDEIIDYIIEPFQVPYPCSNAMYQPCTLAFRPSRGTFLNDYHVNDTLHMAVVNSQGGIVEFDTRGLIFNDFDSWTDCITFKIIPSSWETHWDETIRLLIKDDKWKGYNFHGDRLNCFNFVIEFLSKLNYTGLPTITKQSFCDEFLMDRLIEMLQYIRIYRELEDKLHLVVAV